MVPILAGVVLVASVVVPQDAPKVVSLDPANGSEVDAVQTKRLVVTFDQAMNETGYSLTGGGPTFPKIAGRPIWRDAKTLVVDVELRTDQEYRIGINGPGSMNTRNLKGVPVAPVAWTFATLPGNLRPAAEQQRRNEQALALLRKTLPERYSYHDLRVKDWPALVKQHEAAILGARTDRGWAAATAKMLAACEDLHLSLQLGEQRFWTGTRRVDPLFRRELLDRYVRVEPVGKQVLAGRTADDIGYLLVGAWTADVDIERVGGAIVELADTKAMVIDARPNGGGDERLAMQVAAWFVEGTKTYARHRLRRKAGPDGFGPIQERALTGNGEDRRYDQPIVVLTSRYVMSSNESFVLMLRQAKDCTTVGQRTFGSSGNPRPFDLDNGVTVHAPSWEDLSLDGTSIEGVGIPPDVLVECTAKDFEQKDPILAKALELLRAKIGGK
jgi:hypothetical protein